MATEAALDFNSVRFAYPGKPVLLEIPSLKLEKGQYHVILGPSGCGKSTILRLIAGLERPTEGQLLRFSGHMGFVFQEPRLLSWLTVEENVLLPTKVQQDKTKTSVAVPIKELLDLVELSPSVLKVFPHQLSGGMKMRVSLMRSLILRPEILLLDEPLAALDEPTRWGLQEKLRSIQVERGLTFITVTHSLTEALFLADRIWLMRSGQLEVSMDVHLTGHREARLRTEPTFLTKQALLSQQLRSSLTGGQV